MEIVNEKIVRFKKSDKPALKAVFASDKYPNEIFSGGGDIIVEHSSDPDFSSIGTILIGHTVSDIDGSNSYNVENNKISSAEFGKLLSFKIGLGGFPAKETSKFIRLRYTENGKSIISNTVLFTSLTSAVFDSAILTTDFIPKKVKLELDVGSDETYDITILVSNNALDLSPVFEDMTAKFLTNSYFEITNATKEPDKPWAVQVRVSIKKPDTSVKKVEVENMNILIL